MKHIPLRYDSERDIWRLDCPRGPTPNQVAWLKKWLVDEARKLPDGAGKLAAISGKLEFNVLGDRMNGLGDIRLFEAPKPRETMGVF